MVKDSISQNIAALAMQRAHIASSKTVTLAKQGIETAVAYATRAMEFVETASKEKSELTTLSIGVSLLCFGMFGLWLTILLRTGI